MERRAKLCTHQLLLRLLGVKLSLVCLYPHEKGDFSPFMADWGPTVDEETNQNNSHCPVFPKRPTYKQMLFLREHEKQKKTTEQQCPGGYLGF